MGMIQIDNAANLALEPQVSRSSVESLTCLTIRTGDAACIARFYPALYQLTLVKNGIEEKIDLGFSGSRLLERLVRNPGEVVDRDELMGHAWSGRVVGQGSLNQQIYTLRQILNDEKAREIIQTLPRRGYLLNPNYVNISLEIVTPTQADETANAVSPEPEPKRLAPAPSKWSLPIKLVPMALLGVASLMVLGVSLIWGKNAESNIAHATMIHTTKALTITYSTTNAEELAQLRPVAEDLNRRLATKLSQPLQVVLGMHENSLDLVCLHVDGSASSLHIHQSRVHQLVDADLVACLP